MWLLMMMVAGWVGVVLSSLLVVVMELLLLLLLLLGECGPHMELLAPERSGPAIVSGRGWAGVGWRAERDGGTRYLGAGNNIGVGQRDWNLDGGWFSGRLAELVGMEWVVTSDTIPVQPSRAHSPCELGLVRATGNSEAGQTLPSETVSVGEMMGPRRWWR